MKKVLILLLTTSLLFSSCLKRDKVVVDKTPKNLVVWNLFDDSEVFEGQIQSFVSLFPGTTIKYKKFSKIDFYEDLLLNQLAEGKGPDIFVIKNTDLQKWKGKLQELVPGLSRKPMNVQIYNETFLPVVSENLIDEGKIYGMSAYVDTLALYYNKSYFEDNFASGKPANTWNKLTQQVQQMTRTNNSIEKFALSGIAMGRSDNISRAVDILYLLMMQYGTQFFDNKTGKAVFSDVQGNRNAPGKSKKPGEKALTLYTSYGKSLFKNYSWNKNMTAKYEEKTELHPFVFGKTAAIFGYSYLKDDLVKLISQYKSKGENVISKKDIGITEVPQVGSFSDTGKRDALVSYFPFVVSKNSQNPKLAWDFLMYLSSKESSLDYFEKTNKVSSRLDLIEDQKLEKTYGVFARLASYGKSYPDFIIDSTKYDFIFSDAIDKISNSKAKPQTAISYAQRQIQCLIDKDKTSDIYKKCL